MTPAEVLDIALKGGGGVGIIYAVAWGIAQNYPGFLKARTEARQAEKKDDRDDKEYATKEIDHERELRQEAEARADHWKGETDRIWKAFTLFQAKCLAKESPCKQEIIALEIRPYRAPEPPKADTTKEATKTETKP
jgi:hypothetical protein